MPSNNKILDSQGLGHLITKIKDEIEDSKEVYIGPTEPTGDEIVWINPNGEESPIVTKDYVDGEIERVEGEIPEVSVSDTGTATDEVQYITIDGVEKKLAGGSSYTPKPEFDIIQWILKGNNISLQSASKENLYNGLATIGPLTFTVEELNNAGIYYSSSFSSSRIYQSQNKISSNYTIPDVCYGFRIGSTLYRNDGWVDTTVATRLFKEFYQGKVEANPSTTTETLTGITIGDTSYAISGGSGSSYTFTNGLTESSGVVSWNLNDRISSPNQYLLYLNSNTVDIIGSSSTVKLKLSSGPFRNSAEIYTTNSGKNLWFKGYIGDSILFDSENHSFSPYNSTVNIGTNDHKWNNGYFSGDILANNIPAPPTSDGSYNLHLDIVDGVPTYTWKAEV